MIDKNQNKSTASQKWQGEEQMASEDKETIATIADCELNSYTMFPEPKIVDEPTESNEVLFADINSEQPATSAERPMLNPNVAAFVPTCCLKQQPKKSIPPNR